MTDKPSKFIKCTEAEFEAFVAGYGKPLSKSVAGMCDPPLVSYNDFTRGDWPESVVASYVWSQGYPGEPDRQGFSILRRPHD